MNCINIHITKIVISDLLLQHNIKNSNHLPKLKKLTLSSKLNKNYNLSFSILIQILTFLKPCVTFCKKEKVNINFKKGDPIGIKIVLKKNHINNFLIILLFELLPSLKKLSFFKFNNKTLQVQLKDIFDYEDIHEIYIYLPNIEKLDISLSGLNLENNFFSGLRFPIKKDK